MKPANRSNSTHVLFINGLPAVTIKILFALFAALPAPTHADIIPGKPANEEFELDLGPQGKGLNRDLYGYGSLSNRENIQAGEWGTWELVYHVGRLGVDDGGRIFLLFNAVADWGPFQFDNPQAANYVSVRTDGNALVLAHRNSRHAGPRPFWGGIIITVREGNLVRGDRVFVSLGDRSGGSPGIRAPTIASHLAHEFRFMVDPLNAVNPVRVKDSPSTGIIGGETAGLQALWPSEVPAGGSTWLLVKAKDKWGNPAKSYTGAVRISAEGFENLPATYRFTETDGGYHRFEDIVVPDTGSHVIKIADTGNNRLSAQTNVMVVKDADNLRPYCGDLHGQHIRGSSNLNQYASYARGFAGIDFMSWAVNDFHLTGATWDDIQETSNEFNQPGRFIVFPGYEWSGTTGRGGDHNVIYFTENRPLYRSAYVEEDLRGYDHRTDRYTVDSLIRSLAPENVLLMPHIGGRRANLDFFDPEIMPFIEIYSDHGQFEWFLEEALARGLKAGFTASSDDVYGKPGDSIPGVGLFAVHGGLTCVYAQGLDRQDLWQALKARRVYGTTGERVQLRFKTGDHWFGEEIYVADPPVFSVEAGGTAGIERIEIMRGVEPAYTHRPDAGNNRDRIKLIWRGASSRERARQAIWRGKITVDGGTIKKITRYRLDYPTELLVQESENEINFDTFTAGDEDGVIIDLDATGKETLTFDATVNSRSQFGDGGKGKNSVSLEIPVKQISDTDLVHRAGGLDREIVVRKVKSEYPRRVTFTWGEEVLQEQTTAYWVRVLQEDGATAWSSPIFVTPQRHIDNKVTSSSPVVQEQTRGQSGHSRVHVMADSGMQGWPAYGGAPGGGQYSPLSRIDRHNVEELEVAWVYHSGDVSDGSDGTAVTPLEVNPILANDRLYLCTPYNRIVALDPATGTEEWSHDPGIDRKNTYSRGSYCRGVAYWSEESTRGRKQVCGKRVLSGIGDGRLVAVDADTGRPCSDFGKNGQIDLNTFDYHGEGSISLTSPPAIYRDVVIVGATILDGEWANAPDGIVRGFDVRSGRELWNWNPIPKHLRDTLGGANTWAPISIDSRRGWVFLPTGSPSHDPYGLHRPESIPHGNAVVALDALTGAEIWSYQTLRHDLWDYDLPSMPALVELDRNGSKAEAVLQATKTGFFFILDRDTGRPLFPVQEMEVPQSDVEGEKSSPVQPAPLAPPPFTAQSVTADDAWGLTPWDRKQCRDKILALRNEGLYTPPSVNGSVLFPSDSGGSNWGGVAYDPESGLAVINSTNVLRSQKLAPRKEFEASGGQQKTAGRSSVALMPGTPFVWIRETLVSDLGIPCNPPPWGNLTAIDTSTGEIRWQIPFGRKPFGFGLFRSPKNWGSPNQGGPIITGGGLIFIGASLDNRFRAYDLYSGEELWSAGLPAPGNATPMTYLYGENNRQYVVIAAGGYPTFGTELSDAIVAFALPGDFQD